MTDYYRLWEQYCKVYIQENLFIQANIQLATCKIFNLNFPVSTVRKKIISTKKSSALHQYLVLFIGLFSYEIASSVGYRKPSEPKEILVLNVEKFFFD